MVRFGCSLSMRRTFRTTFQRIFSKLFVRSLNMTKRTSRVTPASGEELGQKLLQSIREMKAGKVARVTQVAPNEVAAARMKTGLSQAQFAKALHISPRARHQREQRRRDPSVAAQAASPVVSRHADVVTEALL